MAHLQVYDQADFQKVIDHYKRNPRKAPLFNVGPHKKVPKTADIVERWMTGGNKSQLCFQATASLKLVLVYIKE